MEKEIVEAGRRDGKDISDKFYKMIFLRNSIFSGNSCHYYVGSELFWRMFSTDHCIDYTNATKNF